MKIKTRIIASLFLCAFIFTILTSCNKDKNKNSSDSSSSGDKNNDGKVSFMGLNNHEAGSKGFVSINNGHFVVDGERIRFMGVNICDLACFPTKEAAEEMANDLAAHGVNAVRLHHMDWPSDSVMFEDYRNSTTKLSEEQLDKMDYLIYCLQKKGIYINMNTHVSRQFTEGDGVAEADKLNFAGKFASLFDPAMIALQKEFFNKFFNRTNQYTGKKYHEDPGIAMVEITNENWIYYGWTQGFLNDNAPKDAQSKATWAIPASYRKQLDDKFQVFLKEKYGNTAGLVEAWTTANFDKSVFGDAGELQGLGSTMTLEKGNVFRIQWDSKDQYAPKVLQDTAQFYTEIEMDFYSQMLKYLKEEIGIKVPITTTSGYFANPTLYAQTLGDFTDTHVYIDELGDKWHNFTMKGISAVRDNFLNKANPLLQDQYAGIPALSKVKGMPLVVSEYNIGFPSKYEHEGMSLMTIYALLQDWDALFAFAYTGGEAKAGSVGAMLPLDSSLDLKINPMKMSQLAMSSQLFIRGDIAPAKEVINAKYGIGEIYEYLNLGKGYSYNSGWSWSFDLDGQLPIGTIYKYRFQKEFYDGKTSKVSDLLSAAEIEDLLYGDELISSGEQIAWYGTDGKRYVSVNAKMAQGVVGFVKGQKISLDDFSVKLDQDGSIIAYSIEDKPLNQSSKVMVNLAIGQENTGQIMNSGGGIDVGNWGTAPVRQALMNGTLELSNGNSGKVIARAIDRMGNVIKEIPAENKNGKVSVKIENLRANYVEISFE